MASCTLLFSGGRDSTLSAARLAQQGDDVVLVTVTSRHLTGISAVHERLRELKRLLPATTRWLQIRQPEVPARTEILRAPTCLPCHRSYAAIGAAVAKHYSSIALAFGYARYQGEWAEQTPYAVDQLRNVLEQYGLKLVTPVYDVSSREQAVHEFQALGLSAAALEQKCLQQQFNVALSPEHLKVEIDRWARALAVAVSSMHYDDSLVIANLQLADL
jgi:hypothetical protein